VIIFKQNVFMNQLFHVEGMTCGHCEKAVTRALLTVDPGAQVSIDRSQNKVQVDSEQSPELLRKAIEAEGYQVHN
jgi:copper chaperone